MKYTDTDRYGRMPGAKQESMVKKILFYIGMIVLEIIFILATIFCATEGIFERWYSLIVIPFFVHPIWLLFMDLVPTWSLNKYPKNDIKEYLCDIGEVLRYAKEENGDYLDVYETSKGIWELPYGEKRLRFDMTDCLVPKRYLCTYVIRNIHFVVMNERYLATPKLFYSMELSHVFKVGELTMRFHYRGKSYERKIVHRNKTKVSILLSEMIRTRYYKRYLWRKNDFHPMSKEHYYMSERRYQREVYSLDKTIEAVKEELEEDRRLKEQKKQEQREIQKQRDMQKKKKHKRK